MGQRKTWIFLPPLATVSGGLQVLMSLVKTLHAANFPLAVVVREAAPWQNTLPVEPVLMHQLVAQTAAASQPQPENTLKAGDLWLVPEGWPSALLPGLKAGLRTFIYAQNWAYVLAELPEDLHLGQLPLEFLAVSAPVAWYVEEVTGKTAQLLRPPLADFFFDAAGDLSGNSPGDSSSHAFGEARSARNAHPPRIAWMPRKNKAMARHIMEMVNARRHRLGLEAPQWVSVHQLSHQEVAQTLRSCDVFLSTGFPEGLGLPPLEALACGCLCVGFSGFGGLDYMRAWQSSPTTSEFPLFTPASLAPALPANLPVNGFWVSDGDCVGAALAVEQALELFSKQPAQAAQLQAAGRATAAHYHPALFQKRVLELWQHFTLRAD